MYRVLGQDKRQRRALGTDRETCLARVTAAACFSERGLSNCLRSVTLQKPTRTPRNQLHTPNMPPRVQPRPLGSHIECGAGVLGIRFYIYLLIAAQRALGA